MTKRSRLRRSLALALAAAALAALTGACDAQARPAGSESTGEQRDLTRAEEVEIDRAEQVLVKKCMRDKGYPYWTVRVAGVDERKSDRYVNDDVAWAREYGLGRSFEDAAEKERREGRIARYHEALPKKERISYSLALIGSLDDMISVRTPSGGTFETPRTGCLVDASTQLYGDHERWFHANKTVTSVTPVYVPKILRDRRLTNVLKPWSRCMSESGYDYADPDGLRAGRDSLTKGMSDGEAEDAEVEVAVAEAGCAARTGLGTTARALEREYRAKELRDHSTEYRDYRRMRLHALSEARRTLT
ncbi:hypothetical protein ABZ353_20270 [Streptomyces niveus]|uniref:hypothetical protein n=1 Tax=Streptomyces niveus TaxID=193462 RepID=UPI0033CFEE60